ncbi:MAG: L,D-transpeptidase family protein [Planctomycetes bacterium]|nr:L,D-transpeptidase family protein [Planctomycetota bacterium]
MRGLVLFALVLGVFGWWSGWFSSDSLSAATKTDAPASGRPDEAMRPLGEVLPPPPTPSGAGQPPQEPLDANAARPPAPGLDDVLVRLKERTPAAIGDAWAAVATCRAADKQRLLDAMGKPGDDFPSLLAALGPHNAFVHSPEGRGVAQQAIAVVNSMPDADALDAGTKLLERMVAGRILQADQAARAFVDEALRHHRIRVDRHLCDPANVTGARSYTIARGDSLAKIAKKMRAEKLLVEEGMLAILNRIHNPNTIKVGQKIKIPVAPLHVVVEKRSFAMLVYLGDQLIRVYWIGHGENDRTPVTEFTVDVKQPKPDWTAPDGQVYAYGHPKNILGEYFIRLLHDTYTGFGIHGTPYPDTICTMSSHGCIRMYKDDIDEVFRLVPRGAKVVVRATESLR